MDRMETKTGIKVNEKEITAFLEGIPSSSSYNARQFTPREDAIILAVWEQRKNKQAAAKALGIAYGTMRMRHTYLVKQRGKE